MKRDMDLIRSVLLLAEEAPAGELIRDFSSLGEDQHLIVEHVWLAWKAGLLDATFLGDSPSNGAAVITRLTPAGHDFIAQARAPVLWEKAKHTAARAGVGATVEVLKTILAELATAAIKAHLRA